jgi:hypothetical protein
MVKSQPTPIKNLYDYEHCKCMPMFAFSLHFDSMACYDIKMHTSYVKVFFCELAHLCNISSLPYKTISFPDPFIKEPICSCYIDFWTCKLIICTNYFFKNITYKCLLNLVQLSDPIRTLNIRLFYSNKVHVNKRCITSKHSSNYNVDTMDGQSLYP